MFTLHYMSCVGKFILPVVMPEKIHVRSVQTLQKGLPVSLVNLISLLYSYILDGLLRALPPCQTKDVK